MNKFAKRIEQLLNAYIVCALDLKTNTYMSSVMGVASAASEAGSNSNFTSASPRQNSVRSPFFSRNNETEGTYVPIFLKSSVKRKRFSFNFSIICHCATLKEGHFY